MKVMQVFWGNNSFYQVPAPENFNLGLAVKDMCLGGGFYNADQCFIPYHAIRMVVLIDKVEADAMQEARGAMRQ